MNRIDNGYISSLINKCQIFQCIRSKCTYFMCFNFKESLAENDDSKNNKEEWKDLYDRINKLEKSKNNKLENQPNTIKNYVNDEIKQLFSRIDMLEKRLDDSYTSTKNPISIEPITAGPISTESSNKKECRESNYDTDDNNSWCSVNVDNSDEEKDIKNN